MSGQPEPQELSPSEFLNLLQQAKDAAELEELPCEGEAENSVQLPNEIDRLEEAEALFEEIEADEQSEVGPEEFELTYEDTEHFNEEVEVVDVLDVLRAMYVPEVELVTEDELDDVRGAATPFVEIGFGQVPAQPAGGSPTLECEDE